MKNNKLSNLSIRPIKLTGKKKQLVINIFLALIATSLLGGILFYKYKVQADIYADPKNYYQTKLTQEKITTTNIDIQNVKDDWRSSATSNLVSVDNTKVSSTDFFNGSHSAPPHNNLDFTFTAEGLLSEDTRLGYDSQIKWIIQPTTNGTVDSNGQLQTQSLLDDYRHIHSIAPTTTDAAVLDAYCTDPLTPQWTCVKKADMIEFINSSTSTNSSTVALAEQNANSYQSFQKGTVSYVGKEEQVKSTTKSSYLDPSQSVTNFTSTTGASLYKTAKDAENILSTNPYLLSGTLAQSSTSIDAAYTTNSESNPAFIPTDGTANQAKDSTTQINQSNTGKLYTSPVVFDTGNKLSFNYSYSVRTQAPKQNLDPSDVLIKKYPDNQCNAITCYDLLSGLFKSSDLQDGCTSLRPGPRKNACLKELQKINLNCSTPNQAEIYKLPSDNTNVCSLDKVTINSDIRNPLQAPIGGSIVSSRLSQSFNNFSSNIRFNPLSPVLYTPIAATFDLKSTNAANITLDAPKSETGYLVGGKVLTLQSQLIKSFASNSSISPYTDGSIQKIFKGAYTTSDDRTIGIGFVPPNTPNAYTQDFGSIYVLDNADSSYGSISKDSSDRKLYDFIGQLQSTGIKFGQQTFSNDSKIIFSEGNTNKELDGVTIVQDILHGSIFNLGGTGALVMFSYDPYYQVNGKQPILYSLAQGIDETKTKVETPSSVTGRICTTGGNCYDDLFLTYPTTKYDNAHPQDTLKLTRTFKSLATVGNTINEMESSDTNKASPPYILSNSTQGKIFTFDKRSSTNSVVQSQNILELSTNDKGEANIAMGQLASDSINWNTNWGNSASSVNITTTAGTSKNITQAQKVVTAPFPFPLGAMSETDFFADNYHNTYNIVTRYTEGVDATFKNNLVIYSWSQDNAPTKNNITKNFLPSFPESRIVGAKVNEIGTAYIVTYKDLGRDKPSPTFIYENEGDKYFKISVKDFDADKTPLNGQPYTYDATNYKQVGYPKATNFILNTDSQFDGMRGLDMTFTTPSDGTRFVYQMKFPYSRTSMFWAKDTNTYVYSSDKSGGFQTEDLNKYYEKTAVYDSVKNQISIWQNTGFTQINPQDQIDGITRLDNMSVLNLDKLDVQNEFNSLGDNGDIKTYAGRKDTDTTTSPSSGNATYATNFCEEKWCVSDSTPYVGDQFVNDCNQSTTIGKNLHAYWAKRSPTPNESDFTNICNSAKTRKVSVAMMLAIYLQESSMMDNVDLQFGCKGVTGFPAQTDCAAQTIANQVNLYNAQPAGQKALQFLTVDTQKCIPGSAFSANMERYTPLDRRENHAGAGNLSGDVNSCNQGLVTWASTDAKCSQGTNNPISTSNFPGCYKDTNDTLQNYVNKNAPAPAGCDNQPIDTMTDARINLRTALMSGVKLDLNALSKGDVVSTLDPRLKLTTACFGSSNSTSTSATKATNKQIIGKDVTLLDTPVNQYINQGFDGVGPNAYTACGATTATMISEFYNKITPSEVNPIPGLPKVVGDHSSDDFLKKKFPILASSFTASKSCGGVQNYVSDPTCQFYDNVTIGTFLSKLGMNLGPDLKRQYDSPQMFDQIKSSISVDGKPLLIIVNGTYHGYNFSHIMMVVGYGSSNGSNYLVINDPWNNRSLDPSGITSAGNKEGVGGYHAIYPYDQDLVRDIISINSITG